MRRPLFVVAILGLLVSGYLLITYTTGEPISCGIGHGCDEVRASEFASHFGIPTPTYGVLFYLLLACGALLVPQAPHSMKVALRLLTSGGLLTSVYLTYLEAFVIHAWCMWCVVSAVLTVVAFWLVWRNTTTHQVEQVDSGN